MPNGSVSFHRRCIESFPDWENGNNKIGTNKLYIKHDGTIEDAKESIPNILEVDFANKIIG